MKMIFILLLLFNSAATFSRICTTTGTGDWNTAGIWNNGTPADGDTLLLCAENIITVTSSVTITGSVGVRLEIYGCLTFNTGKKISLPCNSVVIVHNGGSVVSPSGGGSNNLIEICGNTVWHTSMGTMLGPTICDGTGCRSILPVTLSSFNVRESNGTVIINWKTLAEINNDYFTIERSIDATNFSFVGQVAGNANSNNIISYNYFDIEPYKGISYYRLRQTDFDGTSVTYSPQAVKVEGSKRSFLISPNPISSREPLIHLRGVLEEEELFVRILSLEGREIFKSRYLPHVSEMTVSPQMPMTPGIYFIEVAGKERTENHRLLVE